jgi:hypothetical protein
MKLDFALLAEAVTPGADGRLFIHGAPIKRVNVPALPWATAMGVAVSFDATLEEAGRSHAVTLRFTGPSEDPRVIETPPMQLRLPEPGFDSVGLAAHAAIQFGLIGLTHEGWHEIEISVDGEPIATLRFRVVVVPEPAAALNAEAVRPA